jgi:hypothetical protein
MTASRRGLVLAAALLASALGGCATTKPYDYTNYRAYPPRSILVLPPVNESMDLRGTYGYLSTVTRPLAELGYYVYPVVLIDHFFKEQGMPTPGDMAQAPLGKIREIIGADAVLYITLRQYGTRYQVLASVTSVSARARLVDTRTGTLLWEGTVVAQTSSGATGNILGDLISAALSQVVGYSTDQARTLSEQANAQYGVKDRGLLHGPYSPKYGQE